MKAKQNIWARVLHVFSGAGFLRGISLYLTAPTIWLFILVALAFAAMAIAYWLITRESIPIAWLS